MGGLSIEAKKVGDLSVLERDAWRCFAAADPALAHPYFDLRYAQAAADAAPGAGVAVLRRGSRAVGFLPFQRRGGVIQPLGAPLSDYHGLIAEPGEGLDLCDVVERLGGRVFRFNGLTTRTPRSGWIARRRMIADVSPASRSWAKAIGRLRKVAFWSGVQVRSVMITVRWAAGWRP